MRDCGSKLASLTIWVHGTKDWFPRHFFLAGSWYLAQKTVVREVRFENGRRPAGLVRLRAVTRRALNVLPGVESLAQ